MQRKGQVGKGLLGQDSNNSRGYGPGEVFS